MSSFICSAPIYEYKGWIFEYGYSSGPWPLTKKYESRQRAGAIFWEMFSKWNNLTDKEKYVTRIGGGCERF